MHRSSRFLCDGQCSGVYHRHMISARAIKEQVAFSYSLLLLLVMVCACMQVYVRRAECVSVCVCGLWGWYVQSPTLAAAVVPPALRSCY